VLARGTLKPSTPVAGTLLKGQKYDTAYISAHDWRRKQPYGDSDADRTGHRRKIALGAPRNNPENGSVNPKLKGLTPVTR